MNVDRAHQRADRIALRLQRRVAELEAERSLRALPPQVIGGALIIPAGLLSPGGVERPVLEPFSISRKEVEERAVAAVLATEEALGWDASDMNEVLRNHPGYDVRSTRPRAGDQPSDVRFIEVKGRIAGAPTVTVSRNEILTSLNEPDRFVLALVEVSPTTGETVRLPPAPLRRAQRGLRVRGHQRQLHLGRPLGPGARAGDMKGGDLRTAKSTHKL